MSRERRLWILVGLLTLAIYSSLYFVRWVAEALREAGLLRAVVFLLFALTAMAILFLALRRKAGWREVVVLSGAGLVYVGLLAGLEMPEERVHFLEYGLLGGLILEALRQRWVVGVEASRSRAIVGREAAAAAMAILSTTALGWGDEGIQALLPNRVYDPRDIVLNSVAGALCVAVLTVTRWTRNRDLAARSSAG